MEGRLGRASSRYGPTTTVFNGPVRRWKKMWVHVAQSSPSTVSYDHTAQSNGQNTILLRRWTPTVEISPDEPPRRKFRYTPIAVLEERKVSEEKVKPETSDQSQASESRYDSMKETMGIEKNGSSRSNSTDLDLGLDNDENATTGENIIDDLF